MRIHKTGRDVRQKPEGGNYNMNNQPVLDGVGFLYLKTFTFTP